MQYLSAAPLLKARVELLKLMGTRKPDPAAQLGKAVEVVDLSTPCGHRRTMRYAPVAAPVVLVESKTARPTVIERIDLLANDADFRLSRYGLPSD